MAIFVSHSVKDVNISEFGLLQGDLKRMRYSVWLDQKLIGGQSWWNEILDQIRRSDLLLFALSQHSIKSEACLAEVEYALATHRPVLPVKIAELANWEVPESIARIQMVEYSARGQLGESSIECIWALKDALYEITSRPASALPEPLPPSPEVPLSYMVRLREMASTAELTYLQQEQLIREVTGRLQDVDIEERSSLADILGRFRQRPDIALIVAQQVDQVIKTLLTTPKSGLPKALGPWDVPPSETMLALFDRLGNRGSKPPIITIPAAHLNLSKMADSIKEWYTAQGLEVQELRESSRMLLQCRSRAWQRRVGAGMAISVILWMDGNDLLVQIGSTKWIDKIDRKAAAAGAGIAAVLLSPLLIVPAASIAVGASRQNRLSEKTIEYIKSVIPDYLEEAQAHSKDGSEVPRQLE